MRFLGNIWGITTRKDTLMDDLEQILLAEIDRFLDNSRMLPVGVELSDDILCRFKRNLANHLSITTYWYFREVRKDDRKTSSAGKE